MTISYTVDTMVTEMRRAGKLPAHDQAGTAAALLAKLNAEQRLYLNRLLRSTHERFRQVSHDITTVAGTLSYQLPARSLAAGIVSAAMVNGTARTPLRFFDDSRVYQAGNPTAGDCYLEGGYLVFFEDPGAGTLRVTINRRLGELVLEAEARAITTINTATKTVGIAAAPSTFTGRTAMDFVKATPHFDTHAISQSCSSIGSSATSIVFSNTLPTNLAVGDYVCLPGETPVCNAPWELHDVLVHKAAHAWLVERGDPRAAALATQLWGADGKGGMEADAMALLSPRVATDSKPLLNFNAPGWNRYRGRWRWPTS